MSATDDILGAIRKKGGFTYNPFKHYAYKPHLDDLLSAGVIACQVIDKKTALYTKGSKWARRPKDRANAI